VQRRSLLIYRTLFGFRMALVATPNKMLGFMNALISAWASHNISCLGVKTTWINIRGSDGSDIEDHVAIVLTSDLTLSVSLFIMGRSH